MPWECQRVVCVCVQLVPIPLGRELLGRFTGSKKLPWRVYVEERGQVLGFGIGRAHGNGHKLPHGCARNGHTPRILNHGRWLRSALPKCVSLHRLKSESGRRRSNLLCVCTPEGQRGEKQSGFSMHLSYISMPHVLYFYGEAERCGETRDGRGRCVGPWQ